MARGESQEPRGSTSAYGLWAGLLAVVLGVGLLVALTLRECDPTPSPLTASTSSLGVLGAFAELGDRDHVNPWDPPRSAAPPPRGYALPETVEAITLELPFVHTTDALADLCGVVRLEPEATSRIEEATVDGLTLRPTFPEGPVSFAVCGARELRVPVGVGRARVSYWVMPGLTPADVAAGELPVEAALGLAEAESVLRANGWRATRQAIRVTIPASSLRWEPPRPRRGCVPWVVVALGFQGAMAEHGSSGFHADHRPGRQLLGAVSCDDGGVVRFDDVDGDGGTIVALPFERGGGPRVPGPAEAHLTTVGDVRLTTLEALRLPEPE